MLLCMSFYIYLWNLMMMATSLTHYRCTFIVILAGLVCRVLDRSRHLQIWGCHTWWGITSDNDLVIDNLLMGIYSTVWIIDIYQAWKDYSSIASSSCFVKLTRNNYNLRLSQQPQHQPSALFDGLCDQWDSSAATYLWKGTQQWRDGNCPAPSIMSSSRIQL